MPSSTMTKTDMHSTSDTAYNLTTNKKFERMYYPSNNKGGIIVNARTGVPYPWRTCSINELRLFRVVDSSGRCDSQGYFDRGGNHRETFNKEPNRLYYDGPNDYMKHRKQNVDPAIISAWNDTRAQLFPNGGPLDLNAFHNLKASGVIRATLKT